ncbi:MAG: MBOAT family protein [Ruminococcus sp.]|nr:MBOAT family protein [Ruminococcus sp.]
MIYIYLFLPLCIGVYFLAKTRWRNGVLIAFSLFFYAWGEPVYLWLMLLSTCMNYLFGRMISYGAGRASKLGFVLGLVMNLGLLAGVKYTDILVKGLNTLLGTELPVPGLILPMGLSFFTLRAISYIVDCYWGRVEAENKFSCFLLYMTLFPITAAGPVVRYESIQEELVSRTVSVQDLSDGMGRIVIGLAKKVLLADSLAAITGSFLGGQAIGTQTALGTWYGVLLFALQVYFDFSGYSDIAIGTGRLFGFRLEENFRSPFSGRSITDFWQRWHISLGAFFRDYVLDVSLYGRLGKSGGILLCGLLAGLWHGGGWNFVIWGLFISLLILLEGLLRKETLEKIPLLLRHLYTKILVGINFAVFFFTDPDELLACLKNLFFLGGNGLGNALLAESVKNNLFVILAAVLCCSPLLELPKRYMKQSPRAYMVIQTTGTVLMAALLIVSSIFMIRDGSRPFVYLQF